jgi:lactoylglutathione lyase
VQLALNVSNLTEAIEFYSKMFNTKPAKVREGYANFAIAEPPLKLQHKLTNRLSVLKALGS